MTLAKHGLTEQTLKNLMFGAGVYFKNLKFQTDQWIGTVLGATSGGGKTSYEPQYQDAELDGALVKLRNGTFKMGETCVMTMTVTEISEGVIPTALHLELASAQNATGYKEYNRMLFDYKYVNRKFVLEKVEQPKDELTELKERQERTEQAVQDLILATMGV